MCCVRVACRRVCGVRVCVCHCMCLCGVCVCYLCLYCVCASVHVMCVCIIYVCACVPVVSEASQLPAIVHAHTHTQEFGRRTARCLRNSGAGLLVAAASCRNRAISGELTTKGMAACRVWSHSAKQLRGAARGRVGRGVEGAGGWAKSHEETRRGGGMLTAD